MALSAERKKYLMGMVSKIRENPELLKQIQAQAAQQQNQQSVLSAAQAAASGFGGGLTSGATTAAQKAIIEGGTVETQTERAAREALLADEQAKITGGTIGGVKYEVPLTPEEIQQKLKIKAQQERQKAQLDASLKLEEGGRAAQRSLSSISTTLNDFSQILVNAFDEGGFGDAIKATKTALKQRYAGGLATKNLVSTGKIPGKKVEIITKMMPLLTQQGDKPGSVRLVSTVFERLSDSLPGHNKRMDVRGNDISLEEARGMMEATIKSMFRYAEAIKSLGITNEDAEKIKGTIDKDGKAKKGSDLDKVGQMIADISKQFYTEDSLEGQRLQEFINTSLKPLDNKIQSLQEEKLGQWGEAQQNELDEINRQLAELENK